MKKIIFILGICLLTILPAQCEEVKSAAPSADIPSKAEEVNSSFSQSKNTKWFIHKIKPTDKTKIKTNSSKDNEKEKIKTIKPAEKTLKEEAKEEKIKADQEKERQQYRELQELTERYQLAIALYNDNNLDDSLEAFTKIPEDKRPPEAWLLMGNILMDKGKKEEAVFMYGRAILTDSTFYKAYYNLGNIYLAEDKYNMAVEQYKMAGKYNPNNPYVFYNLGCTYLKLGDLKKAKNAFIRALEIKNSVADFHYNLAYTYKKMGKEKLAKTYLENYNKLTGQAQ